MKLLLDENISYRVLKFLRSSFEDSAHVSNLSPVPKTDLEIWNYAKENSFTIVTFDEDFYEWQVMKGYPPKVIWLRSGNVGMKQIAEKLNSNSDTILEFNQDKEIGIIEIS